ncbi:MAG: UbiA family prenyltransferase [Nitrospira sp.]|nr:UbiA family prenyltransferase [Nitrospira sp.]
MCCLAFPVAVGLAALYPSLNDGSISSGHARDCILGWGAIMAWAAVREQIELSAWLLFGATTVWAIAYDTIYAVQDLKMTGKWESISTLPRRIAPSRSGPCVRNHAGLFTITGWLNQLQWPFYCTLAGVGLFFMNQVRRLQQPVSPADAFAMFRSHIWAGLALLFGLLSGLLA